MSFVRDDLNAICARLTATLREIEERISTGVSDPSTHDHDLAELSSATLAADKLRYAAHFQSQKTPGALAAL